MTTNANTGLGGQRDAGQFFNEPTGSNLVNDMQQICAGATNANNPRLVL